MKKGFSAYEEIDALARRAFGGSHRVEVAAALTGDEFVVTVDDVETLRGTSEFVRAKLEQALTLLDK